MTIAEQTKKWKAEEQRQATLLGEAINKAIMDTGKLFDTPILNAVAGALVGAEANILASVKDPHQRKELRKAMERARPAALAVAMAKTTRHVQTHIIGGRTQ